MHSTEQYKGVVNLQRKIKTRNRVISLCLVIVTVLTLGVNILSSAFSASNATPLVMTASADSNDRRRALISFARDRNLQELTEDGLASLTNEDLTMIGMFLSNFYVPWSTSIQSGSEGHDDSVERMVDALVACNFDKDVARVLVEMIFKLSEDTAKPLNARFNERYGWISDSVQNSSKMDIPATWGVFLYISSIAKQNGMRLNDSDKSSNSYRFYPTTRDRELYWEDEEGNAHTVFKFAAKENSNGDSNGGMRFNSCSVEYAILSAKLNYKKGLAGNSLFMCSKKEVSNYSLDELEELFVFNAPLYVDCFGNILVDCGTEAFVVIPAASNPYAWRLSENGKTTLSNLGVNTDNARAGEFINNINLFNIGYAASGYSTPRVVSDGSFQDGACLTSDLSQDSFVRLDHRFYVGSAGKFPGSDKSTKISTHPYSNNTDGSSLFKTQLFTIARGDSETGLDTDSWCANDKDELTLSDFIKKQSGVCAGIESKWNMEDRVPEDGYSVYNPILGGLYNENVKTGTVIDEVEFLSWGNSYFRVDNDGEYTDSPDEWWQNDEDVESTGNLKGFTTDDDIKTGLYSIPSSFLDDVLDDVIDAVSGGGGSTPVTILNYTDFIMINSLGDLDKLSDFYTKSVTDIDSDSLSTSSVSESSSSTVSATDSTASSSVGSSSTASSSTVSSSSSTSNADTKVTNGMLVTASLFDRKTGEIISGYKTAQGYLNRFSSVDKDGENAVCTMPKGMEKSYAVSIYLSYIYAYFGGEANPLSWEYNKGAFPSLSDDLIDWGDIEIDTSDERDAMLKSMWYYLAHPTEGIEYVKVWFKNKVGGILAGWHEDMAGASHTTATTGTTRYVGFMGYVTTPQLHDLTWTDWLLTQYDSLIVYFIIIMMVVLLLYVLVGTLTVQKAIAGLAIFAICAFLPPKAINTTVDISNRVCDSLYGSKFTYWALVQHEQYVSKITEAINTNNNDQFLASIFNEQSANASDDYAVVTVKWMCPKKDNYMANIEKQLEQTTTDNHVFRLLSGLVRDTVSGEDYLDSADSLYLYRSYSDISAYSNYGYKQSKQYSDDVSLGEQNASTKLPFDGYGSVTWESYINYYADAAIVPTSGSEVFNSTSGTPYYSLIDGMNLGFELSDLNANGFYDMRDSMRYYAFLKSSPLDKAIKSGLSSAQLSELTLNPDTIEQTLAGISQKDMDFGLHDITNVVDDTASSDNSVTADQLGDFVYANYTESPFYYFSYNLYDQLATATKRSETPVSDYKGLFLSGDEYSYFYNMAESSSLISGSSATGTVLGYPGYGQLRDYMDMRTLFCVVIPRLKQANDVVVDWDNTYGLTLYEDVPIKYLPDGSFDIPQEVIDAGADSELAYKYWHNANVVQLFNMYTPWVDTMYDCNYAKEQTILVNGEKFTVKDPLNPYSYFEKTLTGAKGRPMIFSRSEMEFFGLRWKDLTTVEQKIIEVQDNCYETLLQLIDYYNFNEEVLNTGASMLETFEFNKVFSQTSIVGDDYILYPQSYELKNFSYDAYLRLMLSNSTGESIATGVDKTDLNKTGSFYQDVIGKSSIMTGIMLIVVDLFAVYAVPALKMGFIVMLFFLSVLVILAASISLEIKVQNVLLKSLVFPLLKFLGISIGMAFLVSLFMSDGNTAVTNRKSITISLGDPVMLLIVMLVINAGVLILYAKLCKSVFDDVKRYFQAVGSSIVGTFGGALAKIASAATVATTGKAAYTSAQAMGGVASSRGSINDAVRTPRAIGLSGASNTAGTGFNGSSESGSRSSNISPKPSQGASVDRATRRLNKARAKDNKYEAKLARGRAKIRNRECQDAYDKRVFDEMKQAKLDKLDKRHSAGKIDDAKYNEAKSKIENTKFKSRYGGITSVPRGIGRSVKQVTSRKIHGESAGARDLRYSLYTSKSVLNSAKTRYNGAKRNYKVVKKFGKRS